MVLVLSIAGCASRIETTSVIIDKSLTTAVHLTLASAKLNTTPAAPLVGGVVGGPVGLAIGSALTGAVKQGETPDGKSRFEQAAIACGASYRSRTRADGTKVVEINRDYRNVAELRQAFRCLVDNKPPTFKVNFSDGLLMRSLAIEFEYEFVQDTLTGRRRFPEEVVLQMPWKITDVRDTSAVADGKFQIDRQGDTQLMLRVVATDTVDPLTPAKGTLRLQVVADELKFELATVLSGVGLLLSVLTLLFGSGMAKKLMEGKERRSGS